jgi:hypothetical protein
MPSTEYEPTLHPIGHGVGYFQVDTARAMWNEGAILIRKLAVRTASAPKNFPKIALIRPEGG